MQSVIGHTRILVRIIACSQECAITCYIEVFNLDYDMSVIDTQDKISMLNNYHCLVLLVIYSSGDAI